MTESAPTHPDLAGKVAGGSGGIGAVGDEIRSDAGSVYQGSESDPRSLITRAGGSIAKRLLLYR